LGIFEFHLYVLKSFLRSHGNKIFPQNVQIAPFIPGFPSLDGRYILAIRNLLRITQMRGPRGEKTTAGNKNKNRRRTMA